MIENLPTLKGTLYAKETRKVPNKKSPTEPDYEFLSIKVECKVLIGGRTITTIPELGLDRGVNMDGFSVGDQIEVDYYLFGKKVSDSWYKTEAKAVYIKFSDITTPEKPKNNTGKVHVTAMTDVEELNKTFIIARPGDYDDDDNDKLPF